MIRKVLLNVAMLTTFAIAGLMLVPAMLGYHRYIILTGSMTGTYDAGSLVFDKPVPTTSLKVGDPITYAPPPGASPNHKLVTHRIYKIIADAQRAARVFQTKGDANPAPDAWKFMLPAADAGQGRLPRPVRGLRLRASQRAPVPHGLIGIPALLAAFAVGLGMWREAGELAGPEGLPDWGRIDHGLVPAPGALGPLPSAAPARVRLPAVPPGRFSWAASPRQKPAPT